MSKVRLELIDRETFVTKRFYREEWVAGNKAIINPKLNIGHNIFFDQGSLATKTNSR
jgi:hypothetical protein